MMSLPFKHTRATHTLLQKVLQPIRLSHPARGIKKAKFRKVLDPQHADDLPEFEYVGKSSHPDTLVFTWGVADHGGLGQPSFVRPDSSKKQTRMSYMHHPHRAEFGENHKVVDLACGYGFTVFAVKDKSGPSCYGTGLNTDSQIGTHEPRSGHPLGMLISPAPIELPVQEPDRVVKVASGRAHTVMLTNNGSVWTVGNNGYGQCGRPFIPDEDYARQAVYHRLKALDGISVKQVECGQDTSFFLSEEGAVYSCGWGADGQTGRGHYNNEPAVGAVIGDIVGEKIVKVSCRADCALALNDNGDVFGWGNSEYHQLNSVTDEMQLHTSRKLSFSGLKKIVDIASAGTMCLLLDVTRCNRHETKIPYRTNYANGSAATTQYILNTCLSDINHEACHQKVMDNIEEEERRVGRLSEDKSSSMKTSEEGQVYSWGFGPIGKGPNVTYSKLPTPIPSTLFGQNEITPDAKVTSVTCGINQFAVINSQGSLFTWGKNPGGCLGQRHKKDQYFPLRVCIGGQVMKVSCGVDHMAAMVKEIV